MIDVTQTIKDLEGEVIIEGKKIDKDGKVIEKGKEVTLRLCLITALMQSEEKLEAMEKVGRTILAQKIHDNDKIKMTKDMIVKCKELLNESMPQLYYVRCVEILDPESITCGESWWSLPSSLPAASQPS